MWIDWSCLIWVRSMLVWSQGDRALCISWVGKVVWWEKTEIKQGGRGLSPYIRASTENHTAKQAEAMSLSRGFCVLGDEPVLRAVAKVTSPKSESLSECWGGPRLVPLPEEATEAAGCVKAASPRSPTGPEEQKSHAV